MLYQTYSFKTAICGTYVWRMRRNVRYFSDENYEVCPVSKSE